MSLENLFNSSRRILVVGDVMLDRYYEGETSRISPEAPVPIVKVSSQFDRPGGGANVALNIAALGIPVTLLSYTGNDDAAQKLKALLHAGGVECDFIASEAACTIVKLRALSMRQQILRIDFENDFSEEDHNSILARLGHHLTSHDLVVFSDYAKGTLTAVVDMIAMSKRAGRRVLVDPKGVDFTRYHGATVLTPNANEFAAAAGVAPTEENLAKYGLAICTELELDHLLVTRGEMGMTLIGNDAQAQSIPAEAREVFDVTGAGDTVIATLASALVSDIKVVDAMRMANCAASIAVSRKGTAAVSATELYQRLVTNSSNGHTTITEQISAARSNRQTIVMTNGCFDILHAGHVDYLQKAKALGDKLVVAVNSDASITRLKGPCRPINKLEHRMAVVGSLKCVDWVISFDGSIDPDGAISDTPLDLIREIRPDILVKGGDYTEETVIGARDVRAYGGSVEILPLLQGQSTTNILDRLASTAQKS